MPTARFCSVWTVRPPTFRAAPMRTTSSASPPSSASSPSSTTISIPAPARNCREKGNETGMNTETPRVFIAATRQNDGKTTVSLGLIAALQQRYPRVGYIKPVGQRFVEVAEQKIDEDTVLMDSVFGLNCPLVDMSPIAVEPDFTRKYLQTSNNETLVKTIKKAFDRVAWEKDFVLCEGSGKAGVGWVFDLSNAQVAKILGAKVIIVTQGGIGKPIDEVALNKALFRATSSIGLPIPPCVTMITFAPKIFATCAFDKSNTHPTPALPEPSHSTKSFSHATRSNAFLIVLTSVSLFEVCRYLRVKSGSTAMGLISTRGQFRPKTLSIRTVSSSIFCSATSTKRCPTGLM